MHEHHEYGSWETPSCYSWINSHSDWEGAVLSLSYRCIGFWHTAAELVGRTARCWLFSSATGASAWGVLWSLDAVLTTAIFVSLVVCFIKLIAEQVRIIN